MKFSRDWMDHFEMDGITDPAEQERLYREFTESKERSYQEHLAQLEEKRAKVVQGLVGQRVTTGYYLKGFSQKYGTVISVVAWSSRRGEEHNPISLAVRWDFGTERNEHPNDVEFVLTGRTGGKRRHATTQSRLGKLAREVKGLLR